MSKAFAALAALALVAGGLKEFPDAAQQARDAITGGTSQPAVGAAQDASASSDLASSSTIIEMYALEFGVSAGVFVSPGQQTLPDGSPLTLSPGTSITATGVGGDQYCVVARSASGAERYFDSATGGFTDAAEPGGACAALDSDT